MITSLQESMKRNKGLLISLQKTHPEFVTLVLQKKRTAIKGYNIFINDVEFTLDTKEISQVATHRIDTTYFKNGKNEIKVVLKSNTGEEECYKESFFHDSSLKLKKVARGVTFDVFQWKRPKNSNNRYKVVFNGKEFTRTTEADIVVESIYVSNFLEGKNTLEVIAYTLSSNKRFTESLDFNYSF